MHIVVVFPICIQQKGRQLVESNLLFEVTEDSAGLANRLTAHVYVPSDRSM